MMSAEPDECKEATYNNRYVQQALLTKTSTATIFQGI